MANFSPVQPKHRTQERDIHGKPVEQKPTDRAKNSKRARGKDYGQPQQPQSRKSNVQIKGV